MRTRALLAASVSLALALGAYACDDGTFSTPLNVFQPSEAGPGFVGEDGGPDAPAPTDASSAPDGTAPDGGDAGEAGHPGDAGEGGTEAGPADGGDGGELDADAGD